MTTSIRISPDEVITMIDIDLTVNALRNSGHTVGDIIPVPANAGDYELEVDGEMLTLAEVNAILEVEAEAR